MESVRAAGTARTTIVAASGLFQRAEKLARFANAFRVFPRVAGSCRGLALWRDKRALARDSAERQSAVDMNHLARDVTRFVGQQKRDQRGDIRRFGDVPERRRLGGAGPR